MARPRRTPSTPFGAWLDEWLAAHPEVTFRAFGAEVAEAMGRARPFTAGAISQWINGQTRRIGIETLRGIAAVTGEPVGNLEQMVYGRRGETAAPGITAEEIGDLVEERVKRAVAEALARYFPTGPPDERGS